jgi:1,2-phenylacetyl-CoA epoxidase catalytic subunit
MMIAACDTCRKPATWLIRDLAIARGKTLADACDIHLGEAIVKLCMETVVFSRVKVEG